MCVFKFKLKTQYSQFYINPTNESKLKVKKIAIPSDYVVYVQESLGIAIFFTLVDLLNVKRDIKILHFSFDSFPK